MDERKYAHIQIITDCGGTDRFRYESMAFRAFYPHDVKIAFCETEPLNPEHAGFTAAAQGLSTITYLGPLKDGENIGILANAAPRRGAENVCELRGEKRRAGGE